MVNSYPVSNGHLRVNDHTQTMMIKLQIFPNLSLKRQQAVVHEKVNGFATPSRSQPAMAIQISTQFPKKFGFKEQNARFPSFRLDFRWGNCDSAELPKVCDSPRHPIQHRRHGAREQV